MVYAIRFDDFPVYVRQSLKTAPSVVCGQYSHSVLIDMEPEIGLATNVDDTHAVAVVRNPRESFIQDPFVMSLAYRLPFST